MSVSVQSFSMTQDQPDLAADPLPVVPRVSIGMPVYNGENYIISSLDSLLAQDFREFELIISDNASTDSTEQICLGYASSDHRIRYVRQPVNRGAPANFQFVLEQARADLFMWAAADDVFYPNHLSVLLALHDQGNYILAASSQHHLDVRDDKIYVFNRISSNLFSQDQPKVFLDFFRLHHWSYAKACLIYGLFRKNLMIPFVKTDEYGQLVGDDILYLYQILALGRVAYSEQKTWLRRERFYYRSFSLKRSLLGWLRIIVYIIQRLSPLGTSSGVSNSIHKHIEYVHSVYSKNLSPAGMPVHIRILGELHLASLLMPICR
jgi:glycosyltransferase involved in cell wall biosynthesis